MFLPRFKRSPALRGESGRVAILAPTLRKLVMLELTNGLNVRLRAIGVGQITGLDVTEYLALVDMMERGALSEARKRFPLKSSV